MAKAPILAACLAAILTSPVPTSTALAQSADKPLGDILEALEEPRPPAPRPKPAPVPVPADGIAPTPLPPSQIEDSPFGPAQVPDEGATAPAETAEPVPPTEAERLAAEAAAAEQGRLEALDRRRAARIEAARLAHEQALADHQRQIEEREAAAAEARADYEAELERTRVQAERDRAAWQARVRACEAGDRRACLQPGE